MHARPLDRRPLVSPLVRRPPPFTSRFVSCGVVAKVTFEVVSHRLVITRARQWRDTLPVIATIDIASVGVVTIAFVMLTVLCLSLVI